MKKFNSTVIGGAVAMILCWMSETIFVGLVIPSPIGAAVGILCVAGVSWLIPDDKEEV